MKHFNIATTQKYFYAASIAASVASIGFLSGCAKAEPAATNKTAKAIELLPVVQFPNYRGMVVRGDNTPWKIKLEAHWSSKWTGKVLSVKSTLTDAKGKVLLDESTEQKTSDNSLHLSLQPPTDLPLGDYSLKMEITEPNGKNQFVSSAVIRVVEKMPKVYVDTQGFTVVDGKRFFPMGVYLGAGSNDEDDLKRISEGGFNTILSYSYGNTQKPGKTEYLNLAEKYHLKVVYSLKDLYPKKDGKNADAFNGAASIIKAVKDKPAMLAWYTNDERPRDWIPELKKMYEMVRELDDHQYPTLMIQNRHYDMQLQMPYTDILGFDPYPVGNSPQQKDGTLTISSSWTRSANRIAMGAKGVWMVPQMMDWAVYQKTLNEKNHQPTLDEMRNQSYQTIINGAKGLIFYSYFDLWSADSNRKPDEAVFQKRWPDVVRMAKEINGIIPTILEDKKVLLDLPEKPEIEAAAWQQGNRLALLFANPYYETKSITFALPNGWKIKDAEQGEVKSTFADGKATFTLPSVGSGVFYLVKG
jgi:hypothetical protein